MSFVNITLVVKFLKNLLYLFLMVLIRCPDEFIVRCVHQIPYSPDFSGNVVNKFLRGDSCFRCLEFYFLSMFIGSCLESYIISLQSLIPCNTVGKHDLICVSDVRFARCIGNRCCNVIRFLAHLKYSS